MNKKFLKNSLHGMLVFSMFVLTPIACMAWEQEGPTVEREFYNDMGYRQKESVKAVKENGLWGFVKNGNGKFAVKPKYEDIGEVQNFTIKQRGFEMPQQMIPVKIKGLWGCVDSRGKEVIKPRYEAMGNFTTGIVYSQGFRRSILRSLVKRDGKYYYINLDGEVIEPLGSGLSDAFSVGTYTIGIKNGQATLLGDADKSKVKSTIGLDFYVINTPEATVIRTKEDKRTYPVANVFGNGASVIYVYQLDDGTYKIAADAIKPFGPATNVVAFPAPKDPDYYGLYGVDGIFTCIKASDLSEAFHTDKNITGYLGKDNFSFTEPNASTIGIMNASGNILVPATYTSFKYGPSGVVVAQKDGKYGVISPENKELVPFIYKEISDWGNNVVCVFDGSTLGVYNLADNTWRLPLGKYTGYGKKLWKDRAMWVRNGDKWGVSLPDYSREIVPPIYSKNEISEGFKTTFDNKNFTVHIKRNGTVSVVNYDGETIIPFGRYDGIKGYDHKYVCVTKGNKVGLVNRYTGKQIIPAIHDKIEAEGNGKIMATDRTNTGFIAYIYDANGKLVHKEARQRSTSYSNASFIKNWLGLCSEFDFTL